MTSRHDPRAIEIDVALLGEVAIGSAQTLHDDDIHAANTLGAPDRVGLRDNDSARLEDGVVAVTLPPASWTAVTLA